jgi:hypothetical protein
MGWSTAADNHKSQQQESDNIFHLRLLVRAGIR